MRKAVQPGLANDSHPALCLRLALSSHVVCVAAAHEREDGALGDVRRLAADDPACSR
jgi:hypothetical protein